MSDDPEVHVEETSRSYASAAAGGGSLAGRKITSSFWTRTKAFKRLSRWAFGVCDRNKSGEINKTELYAGLILVHLNLAKYVGPAACFPPSRDVVDKLFDASDDDNSGGIDEQEFLQIMVILCSEITSRIITYYGILILMVPYLVNGIIRFLDVIGVDETVRTIDEKVWDAYAPTFVQSIVGWIPQSTWDNLPHTLTSTALFYLVIPMTWDFIDTYLHGLAQRTNTSSPTLPATRAQVHGSPEDKKAE